VWGPLVFLLRRLHPLGGAPTTVAGGCRRWVPLQHVQYPIYFWNIQMQRLKHMSKGRWNTWNMLLKHLQKICEKHMQHMCENICHIQRTTPATCIWSNRWNVENRCLLHTCTTIATYETSWSTFPTSVWKYLQQTYETSKTLKTYACNMCFSPFFFRTTQSRAGNGRFQLAGAWGLWRDLPVARCACAHCSPKHPFSPFKYRLNGKQKSAVLFRP
jgi:hypothetical protein